MERLICKNCTYYRQHYVLDKKRIFRIYCGHCTQNIKKRKKPDTAACEDFAFAEPDEKAFASKAYLSKELLQYIMNLELLPTIEDVQEN